MGDCASLLEGPPNFLKQALCPSQIDEQEDQMPFGFPGDPSEFEVMTHLQGNYSDLKPVLDTDFLSGYPSQLDVPLELPAYAGGKRLRTEAGFLDSEMKEFYMPKP